MVPYNWAESQDGTATDLDLKEILCDEETEGADRRAS